MIIDKIENLCNYTTVVKNLAEAIDFIGGNYDLPTGRHEFAGGAVIPAEGTSAPLSEKDFEAHQNFADVMVILEHAETVSYRQTDELTVCQDYDPARDIAMYKGEGLDIVVTVPKGYFYIVMPGEGHKPGIHLQGDPAPFKKYIIKCRQ